MTNQYQELDEIVLELQNSGIDYANDPKYPASVALAKGKTRLTALLNRAEERGREYSLNESLKAYLAGKQVDAMTMVRGFANIFIAVMCVDTNADKAEITLKDLEIMGKPVGTWKVKAELEERLK